MPRPFAAYAPDAISVGSVSKSFWGGLRVGWVRAPLDQMDRLTNARVTLDLGVPVMEQLATVRLLEDPAATLEQHRARLREQRDALVTAVRTALPDWSFRVPAGGLSLWCELPRPVSSSLVLAAEQRGVRLAAGPLFAPEGGLDRFVRLPFSQPAARLEQAVDRLAEAWGELPTAVPSRRKPAPALVT